MPYDPEREITDCIERARTHHRDILGRARLATVSRAPGRLDVAGGVADYSGSVVLETTIAAGTVALVVHRNDPVIAIRTDTPGLDNIEPYTIWPLSACLAASPRQYPSVRKRLLHDPRTAWSALVAGCLTVLAAQEGIQPRGGLNVLIRSNVPVGAGVASSAALEVASMAALCAALNVELPGERLAALCQEVENQIAGAPCGIMDQMTAAIGRQGKLLRLRCNPQSIEGFVDAPSGAAFLGIDSGVKHSVSGRRYARTRIGAFMALAILRRDIGGPLDCLCSLAPREFVGLRGALPHRMTGAEFNSRFGEYPDAATAPEEDSVYFPRASAEHAVYENHRVQSFARALSSGNGTSKRLASAGKLMYASHWSYTSRARLGSPETDLLVRLLREAGAARGILGAKITGGGCGGTIAVMISDAAAGAVDKVLQRYRSLTGLCPSVIEGSSPGAVELGARTIAL